MNSRVSRIFLGLVLAAVPFFSVACGTSSSASSGSNGSGPQDGSVNMMVSDASTEDWATIGVKILNISLVPQGGGSPVNILTAGSSVPIINLVQLDQLGELFGTLSVPAGTYASAILTISANPGDVTLVVAADPEAGFAGAAGATIPSNQIQIQGAIGGAGSKTVPVNVNFSSPLVVAANQTSSVDVEFDLSHPAFLVGHVPPASGGQTIWAVNFNKGPVRYHPVWDVTRLVLRHTYGTVTAVSSDDSSITITKDFPVEPPTNPETAIATSQSLTILADATNGTLFYDVDAKTVVTIKNFSTVASGLTNRFVRVAARYQSNGSLVAVRVWAANAFHSVWLSPEGHVLHVNANTDVIVVQNELGIGIPLRVDNNTQFFFRTPWNAVADSTPIGQGTSFLANKDLVRGFKIHASVVDPLASPLVAQTVDIEIARYDGSISAVNANNFTYTRNFNTPGDDYTFTLPYISSSTTNGSDPSSGAAITGFKWWNFIYPTIVDSGTNAIPDFEAATNGTVNFGGTAGAYPTWGESFAVWNDPVQANAWAVPWTVLMPTTVPLGTAATSYANGVFTLSEPGGVNAVPVDLSTRSGSGTLVYQVDRTNGIVTVSAIDITTSGGQNTITNNLISGTPVKVYGIPQPNAAIKAYVVIYFTGTMPTPAAVD
ncbi:MAG TPA: DUF4382 domain-containing protein [Candidatus Acidoferrales bacterium]|jgi:hypothetical protein|nr:DUF4382 domain-containing protein [Candidatus Acidoferrales bacterium]